MGFSMEMNWEIVTNRKAERLGESSFCLVIDGYHLYPLDTRLPICSSEARPPFGQATITKMEWGTGTTTLYYELVALSSVN